MLSLQQIFDKVATHLLKQGKRSGIGIEGAGSFYCMYRGLDGLMCAVGCLIPDNAYDKRFDGASDSSVDMLAESHTFRAALAAGGVDLLDEDVLALLADLQTVHDECDPKRWASALRERAATYGLNADAVGGAA